MAETTKTDETDDAQIDRDAVNEAVAEADDDNVPSVSDPEVPEDVEVAARSADMDKPSTDHRKIFVLGPDPSSPTANPYTEAKGYNHEPNKAATRQGAIDAGLWPTGDVTFVSGKRNADGVSWDLTYKVPVTVAHEVEPGTRNPEVVADDTDNEGATKAANAGDPIPDDIDDEADKA